MCFNEMGAYTDSDMGSQVGSASRYNAIGKERDHPLSLSTSQPPKDYIVHRIKTDELAGYILMTFDKGGLLVTDLNDDFILWSLPPLQYVIKFSTLLPFNLYSPHITYISDMSVNMLTLTS